MTIETSVFDALKGLVSNRVYPDVATSADDRTLPYITFQQVGGEAINFVDSATIPSKHRSRFQINVWAGTRAQAAALIGSVETALRAVTAIQPTVEGAPISVYEPDTGLRGAHQDFSFIS